LHRTLTQAVFATEGRPAAFRRSAPKIGSFLPVEITAARSFHEQVIPFAGVA
jgi:hypothetical protein